MLVVDAGVPAPDRDSGSLRLWNLLRLLREGGYRVAFVADDGHHEDRYAHALRAAGIELVTGSPTAWLRRNASALRGAILSRHLVAAHWLPLARRLAPAAHVVFDTVDLHYLREQRQAGLHGVPALHRRARATRAAELSLATRADTTWVVSEVERRLLSAELPQARILVVSNSFEDVAAGKPFADRRDLLFVGGHRHPPNTDAAWWLVDEIFPRIRQGLPDVRLHLVGADVPDDLRRAAAASDGVVVHGQVPDLAPFLEGCRVALVPLRFGAGVKGKISQSMAHGQPVVTTPTGAEGMHLRPGVDAMVVDGAQALADATLRVYGDPVLWQALADNGQDSVRRHFSFDAARAALRETFGPAPGTACASC